jgi:hypothetical protein
MVMFGSETRTGTVLEMGNNSLSQWIGSRDNRGSTDHFDIVVDKAGGEGGQAGDYLYSVFVPIQARQGARASSEWAITTHPCNRMPPVLR